MDGGGWARIGQWGVGRAGDQGVQPGAGGAALAVQADGFEFGRGFLALGADGAGLVGAALAVAGLGGAAQALGDVLHLVVDGEGAGEHVVLGEVDLDLLVQLVARRLLAAACGINVRLCCLLPQVALAPERDGLADHHGVGAEQAAVVVVLVVVRNRRVVQRAGAAGAGGGFAVQGGGAQGGAEISPGGDQALDIAAELGMGRRCHERQRQQEGGPPKVAFHVTVPP